jgi:hypothetical protein
MMSDNAPTRWLDYSMFYFPSRAREFAFAGLPFEFDVPGDAGAELVRFFEQAEVDRNWIPFLTRRDLRHVAGAYVCARIGGRTVACRTTDRGVRVSVGGGPKYVPAPDPNILD